MKGSLTGLWWEEGIRSGWIGTYEQEMIRFMENEFGALSNEMRSVLVFISLFFKGGHTVLPLDQPPRKWGRLLGMDNELAELLSDQKPDVEAIRNSMVAKGISGLSPIMITENGLSFRNVYLKEEYLLQWIRRNSKNNNMPDISKYISKIFPDGLGKETDWQMVSAVLSTMKPFLIISGGPGTGKTTAIARILALHYLINGPSFRVALAAPTGKAAGRMGEALARELSGMNLSDEILAGIPKEAKTLHRLLAGTDEFSLLPPVDKKQLWYDLIVVDEASMIDLNMMHRLISHLGENTRLILLGDKNQLASVEAGAVFSDLCRKKTNTFHRYTAKELIAAGIQGDIAVSENSGLEDSIVYLTKSYRFGPESGIGRLALSVKDGENDIRAFETMFQTCHDLHHESFSFGQEETGRLIIDLLTRLKKSQAVQKPELLLEFWKSSVWLVVLRRGLTGADRLNRLMEQQIAAKRIVPMENGWYHGRPILITRNDYHLGVFNGDAGVCVRENDGNLWVYIESGSGLRRVKPQRLITYEPGWFLTVHKSQGSEFDHVNLLLPQHWNPLVTKELLYTAVTRARKKFSLFGPEEFFLNGIQNETVRYTGLKKLIQE